MKTSKILLPVLAAAAAFAILPASAQQSVAPTAPRCLDVKNIKDTISRDGGKTLTFTLTNGTRVVNHLKTKCDSLQFGGFVWATDPGGEVCANSQVLRALTTGEICRLGNFDAPVKMSSAR